MSGASGEWPEPDPARSDELREFLALWGLRSERLALFDQALTHSSYAFENRLPGNNERLEFLGDSVIGFCVAHWLFEAAPQAQEGELTKRKAALVSRSVLGRRARALGIGRVLRLGRGETQRGSRLRSSVLGSALEALAGAACLELGLGAAREFVLNHIALPCLDGPESGDLKDHKSIFQELVQKQFRGAPQYETLSESGPDHDKRFVVRVLVQGREYGVGEGQRKKTAENQAARVACQRLLEELGAREGAQASPE